MIGQKHLITCRCVLPQFKNAKKPPKHQFVVFSIINDDNSCISKYAQCNNCGLIHKVTNVCESEIMQGKENMKSIVSIDDLRASIPPALANILEKNQVDLATWEQAEFFFSNKMWGNIVLLQTEAEGSVKHGKYVTLLGENFFPVKTFERTTTT